MDQTIDLGFCLHHILKLLPEYGLYRWTDLNLSLQVSLPSSCVTLGKCNTHLSNRNHNLVLADPYTSLAMRNGIAVGGR